MIETQVDAGLHRHRKKGQRGRVYALFVLIMLSPLLIGGICGEGAVIGGDQSPFSPSLSAPFTGFSQLKMLDAHTGWGLTTQSVLKTTDGGKSWDDVTPLEWEPPKGTQTASSSTTGTSVISGGYFLDANHGWIVSTQTPEQANVEATVEANGTVIANQPDREFTITVLATADSGQTWMQDKTFTEKNVTFVQPYFITAHEGWLEVAHAASVNDATKAEATNMSLYHSLDGGISWESEYEETPSIFGNSSSSIKNGISMNLDTRNCPTDGSASSSSSVVCTTADAATASAQNCTVTAASNATQWASGSKRGKAWLLQSTDSGIMWLNPGVQTPGGAPNQSSDSFIATSPPMMFADGTGILPVQMQADPMSSDPSQLQNNPPKGDPTRLFLHLYRVSYRDSSQQTGGMVDTSALNYSDLGSTTPFAVPPVASQHTLSAVDGQHIFVVGQAYNNGKYGDWNLYTLNGSSWQMLHSQTDDTIKAPPQGQPSPVLTSGISTLDFISPTEGWATVGPTVYHVAVNGTNATWSQVFPTPNTTVTADMLAKLVRRAPGKIIQAPANPGSCNTSSQKQSPKSPPSAASPTLHTFTFANNTNQTIWVGTDGTTMANHENWDGKLDPGSSARVTVSTPGGSQWSGRFWGRTGCTNSKCDTGDCGTAIMCGTGGAPPATLAEFTLNGAGGLDYYDVSLVDGFNLPMLITASDGSQSPDNCGNKACVDLNTTCPTTLQEVNASGNVVACKSACEALGTPQYCCTGQYTSGVCNPDTWPSDVNSAKLFKDAYPHDYSYAYDDSTSTYTCKGCNWVINFGVKSP